MATVINAPVKAHGTVTYPKLRVVLDSLQFTLDSLITGTISPSRAVVTDASGLLATSTTTSTEIGYLTGVSSNIQTQLDGKYADGSTIKAASGSAASPGITFNTSSFDEGLYWYSNASNGAVGVTVQGHQVTEFSHTGGTLYGTWGVRPETSTATVAKLGLYSPTASKGSILLTPADNAGDTVTTITNASQAGTRTYTIPDAGASANFVMSEGTALINGSKTFGTSPLNLSIATAGSPTALNIVNSNNSNAASHAQATIETGGSSGGDPFVRFYNNVVNWSLGLDNSVSNDPLVLSRASTLDGTNNILTIFAASILPGAAAGSAGVISIGDGGNYINDLSYKTLTDRGCIAWCDDGVELRDGRRVTDLDALCATQKHPTRKTPTGLPRLDYTTFPKHSYRSMEDEVKTNPRFKGCTVKRDKQGEATIVFPDGKEVPAQDGVEMTMLFGVLIGAFKEVKAELDTIKAELAALKGNP